MPGPNVSIIERFHCIPRTQEEMAHTCRGTVNLAGAFIDNIDSTNFVITNGPQVRGTVENKLL